MIKHFAVSSLVFLSLDITAFAGQTSGGGPGAKAAEQFTLSAPEFQALRDALKHRQPEPSLENTNDVFVVQDESGNAFVIRKAPSEEVQEPKTTN